MARSVYVVGHRNPDTDSICSAVSFAALLRLQGQADAVAICPGNSLRPETIYILERFGVAHPEAVTDVRTRVADVMTSPAVTVGENESLYDVGRELQAIEVLALPVVDDSGQLSGLARVEDFAKVFFSGLDPNLVNEIPLHLDNAIRALDGNVLHRAPGRRLRDRVMVGAMKVESMLRRIEPDILQVMGDREDAQRAAIEHNVGALVITGGNPISDEIVSLAREHQVTLISVPHDTYTTVRLINMSIPVHYIMRRDVPSVQPDDLVEEARQLLRAERTIPVIDDDRRVVGIVSRSDLLNPNRRRVYLVDHNERGQAIDGIDEAEVLGVIDHHRVADFQTSAPPLMRIEPVGSTNTIIAKLYREASIEIPPAIAGVMLGGILADTLIFQSPTATGEDRRVAEELAVLAGVDVETYGREILRVASNLAERTAEELLTTDFKEFKFGDARFGVGVIEIADATALAARRKELLRSMEALRARSGYTSVLLAIVDIALTRTEILVQGHANAVAAAFDAPLRDGNLIKLSGIYSRKKQIVPLLSRVREAIGQR